MRVTRKLALAAALSLLTAPAALADVPPVSTALSATTVDHNTLHTASDGDLWVSCQSDDGILYAVNGDGTGFDPDHRQDPKTEDIVVNQVFGSPFLVPGGLNLFGRVVTTGGDPAAGPGRSVGRIWSGAEYNRKPTGMLCVDRTLYLAVQDLKKDFTVAPVATILKSTDHGRTWTWKDEPLFDDRVPEKRGFTTVFFLDHGLDGADNPDQRFVYAYGLDTTWADRQRLYLARVPRTSVDEIGTWQWSTGSGTWSAPGEKSARQPVLTDDQGKLSQGGVVYDKPLGRYLYSSWQEVGAGDVSWRFYEAPTPWGPWNRLLDQDFGPKCANSFGHNGGYATTMPSKFISPDGRTLWVQSNVFALDCGVPQGVGYNFALRPLWITTPDNLVRDPGFEGQQRAGLFGNPVGTLGPVGAPWAVEGPDAHGVDFGAGLSASGANNAWIHPADRSSRAWNAITQDVGGLSPHTDYVLTGWVQTSASLADGYFGVRGGDGTVVRETKFGPAGAYRKLTVAFNTGADDHVRLFAGYWAPGVDSWLRFDGAQVSPTG